MRDQTRQPADAVRLAAEAMRTRFELVLWGPSERDVRAAGEEALAIIHETEDRLSPFRPGSLVSAISRDGASRPVRLDADTFRLLSLCADVAQRSFHAFDITLWPLMHAWGLRGEPPSPDAPAGGVWGGSLVLDAAARTAHTNDPGVRLDLARWAKGTPSTSPRAIAESGVVTAAFLHAGTSTAIAVGTPAHPFAVRLAAADATRSPTVRLTQGALSVSAPRGGHIIDPESGRPVRPGLELAATLAPGAAEADAWSTALLVLSSRPDGLAGFTPPPDLTTITLQPRGGWIAQGPRRRDVSIPGAPGSADAPAVVFSPAPSPPGQAPCPSATPGAPS